MSRIRVISLDFWNTVYRHVETPKFRASMRCDLLRQMCISRGILEPEAVATGFFETFDKYIKEEWKQSRAPTREGILQFCHRKYPQTTIDDCNALFSSMEELYQAELKPELLDGVSEFISWGAADYALYIVSDTFFLFGRILRDLMERDNILQYFTGTIFSDELGCKKPNTRAFKIITDREKCENNQLVHIGDDLRTDYDAAQQFGMNFIFYTGTSTDSEGLAVADLPNVLGVVRNFAEVPKIIEEA
jgi:putative hydrolase of the HAD superfamily